MWNDPIFIVTIAEDLSLWTQFQPTILVIDMYFELGYPVNKVHGANMVPIWGRQDPGGPHVDPMNLAIWHLRYFTQFRDHPWHLFPVIIGSFP